MGNALKGEWSWFTFLKMDVGIGLIGMNPAR
jgi:hypothetical protein